MLNQFYDYLTNKIECYFSKNELIKGKVYYIHLEKKEQVLKLYNSLEKSERSVDFYYNEYKTKYLLFNEVGLVVAATVNEFKQDYLVTLRNQVEEQKNQWKDKALLFVFNEELDSILGGSQDLFATGMPLCMQTIYKGLKEEILKSTLSPENQAIVSFDIDRKVENNFNTKSIWDFEEDLAVINEGNLTEEIINKFGLFYDKSLKDNNKIKMKKRLEENYKLYEQVKLAHEYNSASEKLASLFDDDMYKKLKDKDNWMKSDFIDVKNSYDKNRRATKALKFDEIMLKGKEEYFIKNETESAAGRRKKNIIIFNPEKKDLINISLKFDDFLDKKFLDNRYSENCSIIGEKINLKIQIINGVHYKKIIYTHNKLAKSKFEFNILVICCKKEEFFGVQRCFSIDVKNEQIIFYVSEDELKIGESLNYRLIDSLDENEKFYIDETEGILISTKAQSEIEDERHFFININSLNIKCKIHNTDYKPAPISLKGIWQKKREEQQNFILDNNKVVLDSFEAYYGENSSTAKLIKIEKDIIMNKIIYAEVDIAGINSQEIIVPKKLKDIYIEILEYYKKNSTCPLLCYMNNELIYLCNKYIDAYMNELNNINKPFMSEEQKNIFKIGMIKNNDEIILTSFHIINVLYKVEMQNKIGNEKLNNCILDRLTPTELVPYIYNYGEGGEVYKAIYDENAIEWLRYKKYIDSKQIGNKKFLEIVVREKLLEFIRFFDYLFIKGVNSPLIVNIINLGESIEFIKGILNFIKFQAEKNEIDSIIPIEINIYIDSLYITIFEKLFSTNSYDKFNEIFSEELNSQKYSQKEMFNLYISKIRYYKLINNGEYKYAHITFYNNDSLDSFGRDKMNYIPSGASLSGMILTSGSLIRENKSRIGFGSKNIDKKSNINNVAIKLNEFVSNLENNAINPFVENESIVCISSEYSDSILDSLYESSYWVTFINPKVDYEFFTKGNELLIVHYSDQLSSSEGYDAITVTKKSKQFNAIVKEYLGKKNINVDEQEVESIIKLFNSINGEWLLNLMSSEKEDYRVKISMVAAVKYMISILNHKDIIWVPISTEEILRVSNNLKLKFFDGVFSTKNLKYKGSLSDDILMIGIEVNNKKVLLHYYPVEVKIGVKNSSAIQKGKEQIENLVNLLNERLFDDTSEKSFEKSFYRNFFIQRLLINIKKIKVNNILPKDYYKKIDDIVESLNNDEYFISNELVKIIGKGAVLAFKSENYNQSIYLEENILIISLLEEDAYNGIIESIESMKNRINNNETDLDTSNFLVNKYRNTNKIDNQRVIKKDKNYKQNDIDNKGKIKSIRSEGVDGRILLGKAEGSRKNIYWEFNSKELPNRHMLITGKSGQGKTYFIQCAIKEIIDRDIPAIIIDYTEGFKSSQLEKIFKEDLGDRIIQYIVAMDKFPLNPFKRWKKELDEGIYMDEDEVDVAERFKSVIGSVYNQLGSQQLNCVYQAVIRGIKKYGSEFNLEKFREELKDDGSNYAQTALAQLTLLIDKNPFKSEETFGWEALNDSKAKVFIVQLTGITKDLQKIVTEIILWDLWNYKLMNGSKDKPFVVVLDECQNLNFKENSPSTRILTEGRKFGWSAWFATQFLKGQMDKATISRLQNSGQKIYFAQTEEEASAMANTLSVDSDERRVWTQKLINLEKGNCISYGLLKDNDKIIKSNPVKILITPLEERTSK